MTIEFNCPNCQKLLRTSDDKAGLTAKCPDCGSAISVPGAAGPAWNPAAAAAPQPSGAPDQGAMKACPMCGEMIKAAAVRCRFCGEELGGTGIPVTGEAGEPLPLDAGEVISTSWEIYKSQMGTLIAGSLVAWGVMIAGDIPFQIVQLAMQANAFPRDLAVVGGLIWFVFYVLAIVVQVYVSTGLTIFLLKVARGEQPDIAAIFRGGPYLLRAIGNGLIYQIAVIIGCALCVVPGIIFALMFWPYLFVLVDSNPPGIGCLEQAKRITTGNWGAAFLLFLASFGIALLGVLMLCVGVILTVPLASLLFAVAYCRLTGQRTAIG